MKNRSQLFYTFGPAISHEGVQVRTGSISTTHPKPGAIAPPTPAPPEAVRALIAQLADLPAQAAEEAGDVATAQARVTTLEQQLQQRPKARVERVVERVEVPVIAAE